MKSLFSSVFRGRSAAIVALALGAMVASSANAAPTFTSFAGYKGTPANNPPNGGELGFTINVPGWTSALGGYNFLFYSPAAATGGVVNEFAQHVSLYAVEPVPDGGSFLGLDSTKNTQDNTGTSRPVSTTVSGLTVGDTEAVSFYWATGQQAGFSGISTDALMVSLGAQSNMTSSVTNPSMGDTNWMLQTFNFTATSTTETLSFLASGTPTNNQEPAFALLDGVSISETGRPPMTPEPSSLMLLATGLVGLGGFVRSRFKKSDAAIL